MEGYKNTVYTFEGGGCCNVYKSPHQQQLPLLPPTKHHCMSTPTCGVAGRFSIVWVPVGLPMAPSSSLGALNQSFSQADGCSLPCSSRGLVTSTRGCGFKNVVGFVQGCPYVLLIAVVAIIALFISSDHVPGAVAFVAPVVGES